MSIMQIKILFLMMRDRWPCDMICLLGHHQKSHLRLTGRTHYAPGQMLRRESRGSRGALRSAGRLMPWAPGPYMWLVPNVSPPPLGEPIVFSSGDFFFISH